MIIDQQADFRSLLMHHVTSNWPDAIITAYDPTAAGHLPDEFSGAGNDVILLGDRHGEDREGIDVLKRFVARKAFPPIIYFGSEADEQAVQKLAPDAFFARDQMTHAALVERLTDALHSRSKLASTQSLRVGDMRSGIHPLIKGYSVLEKLGATETSGVFLAESDSTREKVVLKVLRQMPGSDDSTGSFDRFLQEYETIAAMDHPNIVRIFDLGIADDHAYIAMEYLEAGNLRRRIEGRLSAADAVIFLRQIASALSAVHEQGVLHRDLKPGNIMLRDESSLALIDFGLAKRARLDGEITGTGEIFGTPFYMSPEQGHGNRVDHRSDIYAMGVIFYEMLTGNRPFQADTAMGTIFRHAQAPVPLLPSRFASYQMLINLLLAKNPDDRLQSAAEVPQWL